MRKQKTYKSKNIVEVSEFLTPRSYQSKKRIRMVRRNPTPEEVQKNNQRLSENRLRLLIDNNFLADDYYITLTFQDMPTEEEAKHDIKNFIKNLRRRFDKEKQKLKYIYVIEGKKRIHFHLLINRGIEITTKLLKQLWPFGYNKIELYRGEAEDAIQLTKYFLKENSRNREEQKLGKRKWVSSKNLEKPEVHTKTIRATEWKNEVKVPEGYYLDKDSYIEGVNNAGYPYRFYRLIKIKMTTDAWRYPRESINEEMRC